MSIEEKFHLSISPYLGVSNTHCLGSNVTFLQVVIIMIYGFVFEFYSHFCQGNLGIYVALPRIMFFRKQDKFAYKTEILAVRACQFTEKRSGLRGA